MRKLYSLKRPGVLFASFREQMKNPTRMTSQDCKRSRRNFYVVPLLFCWLTAARASLLINELDSDNPGPDTTEFIELVNVGSQTVSVANYTLVLFNVETADTVIQLSDLADPNIEPGEFILIGRVSSSDVPFILLTSFISDGPGGIALYLSEEPSQFIEGMSITTGMDSLVDAIVYANRGFVPDTDIENLLAALTPGKEVAEVEANSEESLSRCNGSDSFAPAQFIESLPSPGQRNLGCPPDPTTTVTTVTTIPTTKPTTIPTTPTGDLTSTEPSTTEPSTTETTADTTSDSTTTVQSTTRESTTETRTTTKDRTTTTSQTTTKERTTTCTTTQTPPTKDRTSAKIFSTQYTTRPKTTMKATTTNHPPSTTTEKSGGGWQPPQAWQPWGNRRRRQRRSRRTHRSWHHWG